MANRGEGVIRLRARTHPIGRRIYELKDALGWLDAELAAAIGSPQSTVHQWFYKGREPLAPLLRKVAEVTGARLEYLRTGEGPEWEAVDVSQAPQISKLHRVPSDLTVREDDASSLDAFTTAFDGAAGRHAAGRLRATTEVVRAVFGNVVARHVRRLKDRRDAYGPEVRGEWAGGTFARMMWFWETEHEGEAVSAAGLRSPEFSDFAMAFLHAISLSAAAPRPHLGRGKPPRKRDAKGKGKAKGKGR